MGRMFLERRAMRFGITLWVVSLALMSGPTWAAGEPPTRTYSRVTQAILTCMRDNSQKKHGTVYIADANNPNNGTSETHYYGLTRLSYAFDPSRGAVTYTILHKPAIAANGQIWDGISAAIKACS
jgi:hypothetical protein